MDMEPACDDVMQWELRGDAVAVSELAALKKIFYVMPPKWKKTLAYLLVLPGSRARIVRCGGRYDPQLVKRSSE